jgi:hypothetical protein
MHIRGGHQSSHLVTHISKEEYGTNFSVLKKIAFCITQETTGTNWP